MAEQEANTNYAPDISTDFSIRLNELEERFDSLKEKVNLISKNFIIIKEDAEEKIKKIEKQNNDLKTDLSKIKKILGNLNSESEKWVRRDEILLVERMLKDFQPLEFLRRKDFEEEIRVLKEEKKSLEKNKNSEKLK